MPIGREGFEKPIGGPLVITNYAGNVLHIGTALKKGISGRRYDQSLDLGELDTLERTLERERTSISEVSHFQRMKVWEGL